MFIKQLPSQKYLKEAFHYDPETGNTTWNTRPREHFAELAAMYRFNNRYAGTRVGNLIKYKNGKNRHITVEMTRLSQEKRTVFYLHRLVFIWMGVEIPDGMTIDHINGDPWDNSWKNLRIATQVENSRNKRFQKTRSQYGKGVSKVKHWGYAARISFEGRGMHLGIFKTPEEAQKARKQAEMDLFKEFSPEYNHGVSDLHQQCEG